MRDKSLVLVALHRLLHHAPVRKRRGFGIDLYFRPDRIVVKRPRKQSCPDLRNSSKKERYRTGRVNLFRGFWRALAKQERM